MRPRPLPDPLVGRPFTRQRAVDLGVTPRMLDHPRFVAIHRGVRLHVGPDAPTLRLRVDAALMVLPAKTVVTGPTALQSYGIDVGSASTLQFVTTHLHPVRRPGLVVTRVARLPPHRDAVALRPVVAQVRERVESPRETRLRLVLVLSGLPEPDGNLTLGSTHPIGRADLSYRRYRLIVEYDGVQHRTSRDQWNRDIARLEEFATDGWVVVRVTDQRPERLARWSAPSNDICAEPGGTGPPRSSTPAGGPSSNVDPCELCVSPRRWCLRRW